MQRPRSISQWAELMIDKFPPLKLFTARDPGPDQFNPEKLDDFALLRELFNLYFRVDFVGVQHLPRQGGALLVGNHGRTGLDAFIISGLGIDKIGRPVRALGHKNLFRLPGFREFAIASGAVPGTRDNAVRMLKDGYLVLVFPGGHREVSKRTEDLYRLLWGDRVGFVHVARQAGVPIVPFGGIGVEEMFHTLPAWEALEKSRLREVIESVTPISFRELRPPLVGIGRSPLPDPVKLTFHFGEPIPTDHLDPDNSMQLLEFQRQVQAEVARLVAEGLEQRKTRQLTP